MISEKTNFTNSYIVVGGQIIYLDELYPTVEIELRDAKDSDYLEFKVSKKGFNLDRIKIRKDAVQAYGKI